jgi:hypothetical protein
MGNDAVRMVETAIIIMMREREIKERASLFEGASD